LCINGIRAHKDTEAAHKGEQNERLEDKLLGLTFDHF
jgi:hypothetical protein